MSSRGASGATAKRGGGQRRGADIADISQAATSVASAMRCFLAFVAACSSPVRPPTIGDSDAGGVVAATHVGCVSDAKVSPPPPAPDAAGLCGNLFLDAAGTPPNIYFVIDRSGSMQEVVDGRQKYDAVSDSAVKLVRALGARANVGAAVFPSPVGVLSCAPGEEVFPVTPGDPAPASSCDGDGPVTLAFSRSISLPGRVDPRGSTPTAATLRALLPLLAALPGETVVILATDGGPNCNTAAACPADSCIPNIEGVCPPGINCCDAEHNGPLACLDAEPTRAAVVELRQHGIKTYVVGVPGSARYGALLSELANAGGTARTGTTAYFEVEHVAELDSILSTIGATVTVSCEQVLRDVPPAPWLVNVYLDQRLLTHGDADGWRWSTPLDDLDASERTVDAADQVSPEDEAAGDRDAATDAEPSAPSAERDGSSQQRRFRLTGRACADLESGRVHQLQVTFGCPTAIVN